MAVATAVEIRDLRPEDWPEVAAIYEAGIVGRNATFETEVPTWQAWAWGHLPHHRLIAVADGEVLGWAALSPASERSCYRGVAEDSVYVAPDRQGLGVGCALLSALVAGAERAGIWTVQAGVFPENAASIALHEACGFRVVGTRERIGRLDGVWRDVVLLERRSRED